MRNRTSGEVLGDRVAQARSSAERRRGLLGRTALEPGEGLWIDTCEAVHCFFMKFPIDVIHLDRSKRVTKIRAVLRPWRISISLTGRSVLELPAGTAARTGTVKGDQLQFTSAAFLFAAALCGLGCAAHRVAVSTPVTSFDRQIRNAVDAGEGDYQLARLREKVIEAPADLTFRLELGAAYERKGYPELALDHYRLAALHSPNSPELQLCLARALIALHHGNQAIPAYSAFLALHAEAAPLYLAWLGIFYDGQSDWKAGEAAHRAALARATDLHRDGDYLHNNLGYCLLKQDRASEAAQEFRAALRLNPDSDIARGNLAASLSNNAAEAIVHFQSIAEPAAAHNNMAALYIEQGRFTDARKELELSLSYRRAYPPALRNLKIVSELEGKPAIIPFSPASRFSRAKIVMSRIFRGTPSAAPRPDTIRQTQTASRITEPPL